MFSKFDKTMRATSGAILAAALAAGILAGAYACSSGGSAASGPASANAMPVASGQKVGQPGEGQKTFDTPDAAVKALVDALKTGDRAQVTPVFGPATGELVSGDPVEDANGFKMFVAAAAEKTRLSAKDDKTQQLFLGNADWPFAIPLVKLSDGKWFFDTEAGKPEILARRIGANELETIAVCHEYVMGQRDYASQDRDGSGILKFAQHFASSPGKKDGLYWPVADGEAPSPMNPLVVAADAEGYTLGQASGQHTGKHPFHGYYYHILTGQGSDAPGGPYSYIINGNMIAGFALIAWPDAYGDSGIMTFEINHQGKLYQKDLGPDTAKIAGGIAEYNPDSSWSLVKE